MSVSWYNTAHAIRPRLDLTHWDLHWWFFCHQASAKNVTQVVPGRTFSALKWSHIFIKFILFHLQHLFVHISKLYPLHPLPHSCEPEFWECHLQNDGKWKAILFPEYVDNIWRHFWLLGLGSGYVWLELSDAAKHPTVSAQRWDHKEMLSTKCCQARKTVFQRMPPSFCRSGKSTFLNL